MIVGIRQYTEEEKISMKEQSKQRRRDLCAIKKGKVITIKQKVDCAVKKIREMAVVRFERLVREKTLTSGLTMDEVNYIIRKKHFEQAPIMRKESIRRIAKNF